MWNLCSPIEANDMQRFETAFHFSFNPPLKEFLMTHNAGTTRSCILATSVKERRITALLDFSPGGSAWEVNRRMRKTLGSKCIVIGTDRSDNYLCVRRNLRNQEFVIWNHITNSIEECIAEIPVILMSWQNSTSSERT